MLHYLQVKRCCANLSGADLAAPKVELSQRLYAKCPIHPPELGQTARSPIPRILFILKEMYQNWQNRLADLGQTQLWPNIC